MVTTTTFQLVRNNAYGKLKAITPSVLSNVLFERSPREYIEPLREWAPKVGVAALRRLEMRVDSEEDPPFCDPSAKEVKVTATLTVAYPTAPGIYGTGLLDTDADLMTIEDVIAADAKQISDKLHSATNYVAGQNATFIVIQPTDRSNPLIWFKEFAVEIHHYKAQTLD